MKKARTKEAVTKEAMIVVEGASAAQVQMEEAMTTFATA